LAVVLLVLGTPVSANLVIVPTFDSSVTSDPNAAVLESDFNAAIIIYERLFSNPITVSILFRYSPNAPNGTALSSSTLARSNYTIFSEGYNTYINALKNNVPNPGDPYRATAIAHLPLASVFPNAPVRIEVSSANGRAVGLNTAGGMNSMGVVGTGGTFDGIVTVNSTQPFQLTRTGGIASTKYDIMQSIEHEMDEVLGFGSILPNTTDFTGNTAVRPEDLYRYSAPGSISLDSTGTVSSYFSINGGVTDIVPFNQNSSGDYGDWGATGGIPYVQLAFSSKGTQSDVTLNSPEGIGLDAIGYDLITPEPYSLTMFGPVAVAGFVYVWRGERRRAWKRAGSHKV
jgi:hypothetical protein